MLNRDLLPTDVSDAAFALLDAFASLVVAENQKINLTAITDPDDFTVRHIADSLSLLPFLPPGGGRLLDVGSGAGFPGMVLAILAHVGDLSMPWHITLLDSVRKKTDFLRRAADTLGLPVEVIWGRAEELSRPGKPLCGVFDAVTARAVAAMPELCRWCLPTLKRGGRFFAMKARQVEPFEPLLPRLGGHLVATHLFTLANMRRQIVVVEKV